MPSIRRLKSGGKQPRRFCFATVSVQRVKNETAAAPQQLTVGAAAFSKWLWTGLDRQEVQRRRSSKTIGAYRLSGRTAFPTADAFYDTVEAATSKRYETWLVIHRAAEAMQLLGIFDAIKDGRLRVDSRMIDTEEDPDSEFWSSKLASLFVVNDPPTILALRTRKNHRLVIVDSRNYFQTGLDDIGKSVGIGRAPAPYRQDDKEAHQRRANTDCEIIESAMLNLVAWLDANGLGKIAYTSAGQSQKAWRLKYQPEWVNVPESEPVRLIERLSYYGGEVRAFRLGEVSEHVYQLDVNSLYPAVMFAGKFPVDWYGWTDEVPWTKGVPDRNPLELIAEVWIRSPHEAYPVRIEQKTHYCRGSFHTILAGEELKEAIDKNHVLGHRCYSSYELHDHLAGFVHDLYLQRLQAREDSDSYREMFCKMMLTNLHGKFGQMSSDMVHRTDFLAPQQWGTWVTTSVTTGKQREFRCMNHEPWEIVERKEIAKSFPAISAMITAAARCHMRRMREIAGRANLVYQAVDSLIVTQTGFDRLESAGEIDSQALGKLKLEHQAARCYIGGTGFYQIGNKDVLVGRKEEAIPLDDRRFRQEEQATGREIFCQPPGTTITLSNRTVKLPNEQIGGTVDRFGFVTPPVLNQELPPALIATVKSVNRLLSVGGDQVNDIG